MSSIEMDGSCSNNELDATITFGTGSGTVEWYFYAGKKNDRGKFKVSVDGEEVGTGDAYDADAEECVFSCPPKHN